MKQRFQLIGKLRSDKYLLVFFSDFVNLNKSGKKQPIYKAKLEDFQSIQCTLK
jgi:hypothetical protein